MVGDVISSTSLWSRDLTRQRKIRARSGVGSERAFCRLKMASVNLQRRLQLAATEEERNEVPVSQHAELPNEEIDAEEKRSKTLRKHSTIENASEGGEEDPFSVTADDSLLHELNFLSLPSQSNVYGMVDIHYQGSNRLLVATLRGEIFKLEFEKQALRPSLKPVTFSYIPGSILLNGVT